MLRFTINAIKDMDIGDLRVAIFNYILAKQKDEKLLIRIDDTDKEKNIEGNDKEILEILNLFSIGSEQIIYPSDNLKYHQKLVMQLMANKKAFACFCSDEKLNELKEKANQEGKPFSYDGFCQNLSDETVLNVNAPFTVRVVKPENSIEFTDSLNGNLKFTPEEVDSSIILKHDKSPTANYALAVDDMLYNTSIVITKEKQIDFSRQIHIRTLLGYDKQLEYFHMQDFTNEILVKNLIDEGFLPSAIANYLVLLGNETPKEIFTLEEAIEWFDIKNISKESLDFDIKKLRDINKKHLEIIEDMRLSKILGFADEDIGKLGKLFLQEVSTIKEIKDKINLIFSAKSTCIGFENEFIEIKLCLQEAPFFTNLAELKQYITEKTGLKKQNLDKPLTYILTGNNEDLNLLEIYPLIKNYLGEIVK